jgi:N-formylglutamate amidohydrolase
MLIDTCEAVLSAQGFRVALNNPYAGAYTTQHYGKPEQGVHALQIEINRALYMDEDRIERRQGIVNVSASIAELIGVLAKLAPGEFAPA